MSGSLEPARRAVHIGMGAFAFALHWLSWPTAAACAGLALLHNAFVLPRYGRRGLFRGAARERGLDAAIVFYPASVLLLILALRERLDLVAAAWMFMAVGDGLAGLVGQALGARSGALPWNPRKSWAGTAAFVIAGVPASVAALWFVSGTAPTMQEAVACLVTGIAVAVLESLESGIDDNLLVPLAAGGLLWVLAAGIEPEMLAASLARPAGQIALAIGVNGVVAAAAWFARSVDTGGAVHGAVLGTAIWLLAGGGAFVVLLGFFVLGSVATRLKYREKQAAGIAQERGGRRGARHAWANAGAPALFALLLAGTGSSGWAIALVAALCTALADTLGSEIGQAWGRRTVLITTFRPVAPGTDGAVSLEGTLAGVAGAALLAGIAAAAGVVPAAAIPVAVAAAFVGTTLESYTGALLERARMIDNEMQNLLNTLAGGLVALALARLGGLA
ncbi:MAG: DUF92 domain-containing protein [Acidobacteria bacterium]|nr:MAG: DUF92 domain-containing protein [Acidobacteriota bacterium]